MDEKKPVTLGEIDEELEELEKKSWDELIDEKLLERLKAAWPLPECLIYREMIHYFVDKYESAWKSQVVVGRMFKEREEIHRILSLKIPGYKIVSDEEMRKALTTPPLRKGKKQ